jgi:hypothetical protein
MRYSAPLMSELGLVSRVSPVQIRSVSACKIDIAARPSSGTHQNPLPQCTANVADGSKARITAVQQQWPVSPQ